MSGSILAIDPGAMGCAIIFAGGKISILAGHGGAISIMPENSHNAWELWRLSEYFRRENIGMAIGKMRVVVERPVVLGRTRGNSIPELLKQVEEVTRYEVMAAHSGDSFASVTPATWRKGFFGRARLAPGEKSWKPIEGEAAKKAFPSLPWGTYATKKLPNSDCPTSGMAAAACILLYALGEKARI